MVKKEKRAKELIKNLYLRYHGGGLHNRMRD